MRQVTIGLALVSALALAPGCNDSTVNVGNENPTGTVAGLIFDGVSEMPLAGAMVTIVAATYNQQFMTDMTGAFQATDVPAGSFVATISKAGYVTAIIEDQLSGAVGNFPVKNPTRTLGPFGLVPSTGSFTVRIVDENGAPVGKVKVLARPQVRYLSYASGGPTPVGSYEVSGTSSDADGLIALTGLPDYFSLGRLASSAIQTLPIDVPPVKVMGSESYSFLGGTFTFDVGALSQSSPTIVLAGPRTPLAPLEASIDYLVTPSVGPAGAIVPVGGPITIAFNQAINPTTIRASFLGEDGKPVPLAAMATAQTNLLSITPQPAFAPGARYNLQLHVESVQTPITQYTTTAPFFAQQSQGVNPAAVTGGANAPTVTTPASTLVFTLNEPIGQGSGRANAISCVAYYEGADFDNNPGSAFCGDYVNNGAPNSLVCGGCGAALDVTVIRPMEGTGPVTGFSSKWSVQFDAPGAGGCSPALGTIACTKPTSGTKVHLVFSKLSPADTVKRADGTPVDDKITVVIP